MSADDDGADVDLSEVERAIERRLLGGRGDGEPAQVGHPKVKRSSRRAAVGVDETKESGPTVARKRELVDRTKSQRRKRPRLKPDRSAEDPTEGAGNKMLRASIVPEMTPPGEALPSADSGPVFVDAREDPFGPSRGPGRRPAREPRSTGPSQDAGDAAEFVTEYRKEVEVLGSAQFSRKKKRAWEEERLSSLGARQAARPKVPLAMLNGMRKAEKQRVAKEREQQRSAQMLPLHKRTRKKKK